MIEADRACGVYLNLEPAWLAEQSKAGVLPQELGVFVRSTGQLDRAKEKQDKEQSAAL